MTEQPKIVSTLPDRDDKPVAHFIDCGPKPVRHGRDWDFACSIHRYAMENPDRELALVVENRSRRAVLRHAVVEAAREATVAVSAGPVSVKWPNGSVLRFTGKDERGIVPFELMGSL